MMSVLLSRIIYMCSMPYYHHNDRLGSGVAITDEQGMPVHMLAYMPYGETLLDLSQGFETPYQFTGYEKDQETGLNYAEARYYDSDLSIFNSTDPMWHKYPHLTPYHYCSNNPVMRIDPDGMMDDWIYNEKTQEYSWNERVNKESETPDGYEYVGKSMKDVLQHHKEKNPIKSVFKTQKFGNIST